MYSDMGQDSKEKDLMEGLVTCELPLRQFPNPDLFSVGFLNSLKVNFGEFDGNIASAISLHSSYRALI